LWNDRFVEKVIRKNRKQLGVGRDQGARRARDIDLGDLRVMRDLRGAIS